MGLEGIFQSSIYNDGNKALLRDIRALSPYMRIAQIELPPAPCQKRQKLREEFHRDIKPQFIWWLSHNKEDDLKRAFALDDEHIQVIREKRTLKSPHLPAKLTACSIDHITPLWAAGKNDFPNLCVIPEWINSIKGRFEDVQRRHFRPGDKFCILVPARDEKGGYPAIPHFPEEFYVPRRERILERMARIEDRTPANP